VETEI